MDGKRTGNPPAIALASRADTGPAPAYPRGVSPIGSRGRLPALVLAVAWSVLAVAGTEPARAEPQPEVIVQLDRERLFEGQTIQYVVFVNHADAPSPPQLEGLADFDVAYRGFRDRREDRMTRINGQMTFVSLRGREFVYQLTPRRAGTLSIPGPVVQVDGQTYRGQDLAVEVRPADSQDVVLLKIAADRTSVYPHQPFTVTLSLWIEELPKPNASRNPLGAQFEPPRLQLPWVPDDNLPDGLHPETSWEEWLTPLKNDRGVGLLVNGIRDETSVFSVFDGPDYAQFLPPSEQVADPRGGTKRYWRFELPRTFTATRPGSYRFGPVTLEWLDRRRPGEESIYALARPLEVSVNEVPAEGRPAAFTGAVGRFRLSAELRPTELRVGDPATLVLTLAGQGSLDTASPPDLARTAELAKDFRFYEATESHKPGEARFTYSLRPLREGLTQFPPVPLTYFDVDQGKYVTLHSKPVSIHVASAQRLSSGDIVAGTVPQPPDADPTARREGIFGNVTDLGEVRDDGVSPPGWFAGLGGLAGAVGVLALVVHRRRRPPDPVVLRRRAAAERARKRLAEAREQILQGALREGAERVRAALAGLVADFAGVPEAGLTASDVDRLLAEARVASDVRDAVARLLQRCDAMQYGAPDAAPGQLPDDAAQLVARLLPPLRASMRGSQ